MKQLLQSLKDGTTEVAEIPAPRTGDGQVLIRSTFSLISAGTERRMVDFGRASLLQKARSQPDKVRMVLEKMRTDGLVPTIGAVRSGLAQPLAPGYCNVGRVIGSRAGGFAPGDRVVSGGKHAEIVAVPKNLCARIPEGVSDEAAAFTVLAAIGLQGIRLVQPTLGECVVVTGLGLIGLLTVQMLRAQGCRVLGIDPDPARLELARRFGAEGVNPRAGEDVLSRAQAFSRGRGVDAVILTASSKSSALVSQAARMCRKRGRIVLTGVVGLELSRADFYEKELSFQVSCSSGPGRYDEAYEAGGQDYPIGFVRWTEQRNFEAVLDLMAAGTLDPAPLISHRFPVEAGAEAMDLLASGRPSLGILLRYPEGGPGEPARRVPLNRAPGAVPLRQVPLRQVPGRLGVLGAGHYAGGVLIPAFRAAGAELRCLVSAGGVSAVHLGRRSGFAEAASEEAALLADPGIDCVVIATRHDLHARQVLASLRAGKHVFCEKPLCLTEAELAEIAAETAARPDQALMVGFNRRFAPQVLRMKALLAPLQLPKTFLMTVNAGDIPADHWTQNPAVGGGRIIGEACHFIDLLCHLAGAPVTGFTARSLGESPALPLREDKAVITLSFADGSLGTLLYLANGHRGFPKERLEVFAAGRVLQLDNFRRMTGWGWSGFRKMTLWRQDKGQRACAAAFLAALRAGQPAPVPREEILESTRLSIGIAAQLRAAGSAG